MSSSSAFVLARAAHRLTNSSCKRPETPERVTHLRVRGGADPEVAASAWEAQGLRLRFLEETSESEETPSPCARVVRKRLAQSLAESWPVARPIAGLRGRGALNGEGDRFGDRTGGDPRARPPRCMRRGDGGRVPALLLWACRAPGDALGWGGFIPARHVGARGRPLPRDPCACAFSELPRKGRIRLRSGASERVHSPGGGDPGTERCCERCRWTRRPSHGATSPPRAAPPRPDELALLPPPDGARGRHGELA